MVVALPNGKSEVVVLSVSSLSAWPAWACSRSVTDSRVEFVVPEKYVKYRTAPETQTRTSNTKNQNTINEMKKNHGCGTIIFLATRLQWVGMSLQEASLVALFIYGRGVWRPSLLDAKTTNQSPTTRISPLPTRRGWLHSLTSCCTTQSRGCYQLADSTRMSCGLR